MIYEKDINNVNLSGLNTSKEKEMDYMFYRIKFNELDLSSFDTSNVENFYDMFYGTSATVGYARTEEDAARLNDSITDRPSTLIFVVKN